MRRSLLPLIPVLAVASLAPGCRNACQDLCVEIADFARTECGLTFPDDQLDQCIEDHKGGALGEGEAAVCRDGRGRVASEWDCEEIAAYFDDGTTPTGTARRRAR